MQVVLIPSHCMWALDRWSPSHACTWEHVDLESWFSLHFSYFTIYILAVLAIQFFFVVSFFWLLIRFLHC